jgi:tetratricopeptide (TPR) repeat protein
LLDGGTDEERTGEQAEALKLLRQGHAPKRGKECLTDFELAQLAASDSPGDRTLLAHVSRCDWCGFRLREALDDLNSELSPEEEAMVCGLTSGSAAWPAEMAKKLSAERGRPRWRWAAWAAAAACLLVTIGAVTFWVLHSKTGSVEALLAQAYTGRRPFDLRLQDSGYAGVRLERGGSPSAFDKPAALATAEAEINSRMGRGPRPDWTHYQGIAELLEMQPDAAIESLEAARNLAPEDIGILTDLAVAYAFRGEVEKRPADFAIALDLLGKAVRRDPKNARAVFNDALVSEKLALYEQAIRDWKRYLEMDGVSGWAAEARRRLSELESKKKPASGS